MISAHAGDDSQPSFPLARGTYWIYRGLVRSSVQGSTVGKVAHVTWKMSVVQTVQRDGVVAAVVSGFPGDLDWTDGDAKPQLSILIRTQDAKFYLNSPGDGGDTLRQLDEPTYPLQDLIKEDDLFLQLPLAEGKEFGCDQEGAGRDDTLYCWVTGPPHTAALDGVKGVGPGTRVAYEVRYQTLPDDVEFEFVPGVGMTSYGYHHHGTIADTELHLVEFHSSSDSGY
ncbi:MAG TPA: hypothetical protein VN822_02515 [Candidatus Acidoferrales bacterium]|nr:hypothetical protein [Candidatus Acidoferrales bacterium]